VPTSRSLSELAASAAGRIQTARSQWDPSSLAQCEVCREALESAVKELEELCVEAATPPVHFDSVGRLLRHSRAGVEALALQVDASAGFCRGMLRVIGQDVAALPTADLWLYRDREAQV
jgi:hypothetical protein